MRQVKLYTLKEDVVVVTGDHINFHNYPDRLIHVRGKLNGIKWLLDQED